MRFWYSPHSSGKPGRNAKTHQSIRWHGESIKVDKDYDLLAGYVSMDVQQNLHARIQIIPSRGS